VIGYVISRSSTVWTLPGKRLCLIHSKTSLPLTCLSFQRSATEYRILSKQLKTGTQSLHALKTMREVHYTKL
jgi:hypothetical protein